MTLVGTQRHIGHVRGDFKLSRHPLHMQRCPHGTKMCVLGAARQTAHGSTFVGVDSAAVEEDATSEAVARVDEVSAATAAAGACAIAAAAAAASALACAALACAALAAAALGDAGAATATAGVGRLGGSVGGGGGTVAAGAATRVAPVVADGAGELADACAEALLDALPPPLPSRVLPRARATELLCSRAASLSSLATSVRKCSGMRPYCAAYRARVSGAQSGACGPRCACRARTQPSASTCAPFSISSFATSA